MIEVTFSKWKKNASKSDQNLIRMVRIHGLTHSHFLPTLSSAVRKLLFTGTKQRIHAPPHHCRVRVYSWELWGIGISHSPFATMEEAVLCSRQVWLWGGSSLPLPCPAWQEAWRPYLGFILRLWRTQTHTDLCGNVFLHFGSWGKQNFLLKEGSLTDQRLLQLTTPPPCS